MKSKTLLLTWLLALSLSLYAQSAPPVVEVLDGLDPVLLAQGKETQGELQIAVTRGQFKYLFANAENKAAFEKDPARYEIQLGGYCARMGAPVTGNPNLFTVHQGRAYIFGSEDCKKLFEAAPGKYLEPERAKLAPAAPAVLEKGQALIAKAVAAMGGAAKLDGLVSYHEKSVTTQTRGPRGEVEVKNDLLLAFPERARLEVVMPDFNDAAALMRITTVLADAPFVISRSGKVLPLDASQRAEQAQQLQRKPLALLRARAGLKAAYSGAGKVGETAVEQVAVELADRPATLSLDAATGRLLSLSYKRRGPQGAFGEFTQTFSDFRTVDGLTLPFKITATFDGQPWKDQSATIEIITINGAVDPKLFEKPKPMQ